jgi:hypothetical protein
MPNLFKFHSISRTTPHLMLMAGLLAWVGCAAFPHEVKRSYEAKPELTIAKATRLAALAMREMDFMPEAQNEASGFAAGKLITTGLIGFTHTYFLMAKISRSPSGPLRVKAVCKAGPEVAMSAVMGVYVDDFYQFFERRIRRYNTQASIRSFSKRKVAVPPPPPPVKFSLRPPPPRPEPPKPATVKQTKSLEL